MRIGIVSLESLPHCGGASVYVYRLARHLLARGTDVHLATATPVASGRESGNVPVFRSPVPVVSDSPESCRRWYEVLRPWFSEHRFTHVLVNAPLTRGTHGHAAALYAMLRDAGVRIGAIHYDIGRDLALAANWAYATTGDWDASAERALGQARTHVAHVGERQGYVDLDSPFAFDCDFVVSCSHWSGRFVDPDNRRPRTVLHPLLDAPPTEGNGAHLPPVQVSFINPLPHKGVDSLTRIIEDAPSWSFRILGGGYGGGLAKLRAAVESTGAFRNGRVHIVDYCEDMASFYRRTDLMLVPSLYEGYGLAAVEPLLHGTPVVARDYPAIEEGIGDAARRVPYAASRREWCDAVAEVLADRALWSTRAVQRADFLLSRQESELAQFLDFLGSL